MCFILQYLNVSIVLVMFLHPVASSAIVVVYISFLLTESLNEI